MINEKIEEMLLEDTDSLVIPAENVTNVLGEHNLFHAVLLLTNVKYSLIPVLDNESKFLGLISIHKIMQFTSGNVFQNPELLESHFVEEAIDTRYHTVDEDFSIEEVLNALIDHTFVCIVDKDNVFKGIITRSSVLKRVNYLVHELDRVYDIKEKPKNIIFA